MSRGKRAHVQTGVAASEPAAAAPSSALPPPQDVARAARRLGRVAKERRPLATAPPLISLKIKLPRSAADEQAPAARALKIHLPSLGQPTSPPGAKQMRLTFAQTERADAATAQDAILRRPGPPKRRRADTEARQPETAATERGPRKRQRDQKTEADGDVIETAAKNADDEARPAAAALNDRILERLRACCDATGRPRHLLFEALPSRKAYPDYYALIERPLSFACIQAQAAADTQARGLAELEAAYDALFDNAMAYNHEDSQVYADAAALRAEMKTCVKEMADAAVVSLPSKARGRERRGAEQPRDASEDRLRPPTDVASRAAHHLLPKASKNDLAALFAAIQTRPVDALDVLLTLLTRRRVDANRLHDAQATGTPFSWNLLHAAAFYGAVATLCHLIDACGGNPESIDPVYESPCIIWSAFGGQLEATRCLLLRYGVAWAGVRNNLGSAPIDLIPQQGDTAAWQRLFTPAPELAAAAAHPAALRETHRMWCLLDDLVALSPTDIPALFDALPSAAAYPDYYGVIRRPVCLRDMRARIMAQAVHDAAAAPYAYEAEFRKDCRQLLWNATVYNEPYSAVYALALRMKAALDPYFLAPFTDVPSVEPSPPLPDAARRRPVSAVGSAPRQRHALAYVLRDGVTYRPGDFAYIAPRAEPAADAAPAGPPKPIILYVTHVYAYTADADAADACVSGSWFVYPEQTFHSPQRRFYPQEVFRMKKAHEHPVADMLGKCLVLSLLDYRKGVPAAVPPGATGPLAPLVPKEHVYVCEFKYSEWGKSMARIRHWAKVMTIRGGDDSIKGPAADTHVWLPWTPEEARHYLGRHVPSIFYTPSGPDELAGDGDAPVHDDAADEPESDTKGPRLRSKVERGAAVRPTSLLMKLPSDAKGDFIGGIPPLLKGKTMKSALRLLTKLPPVPKPPPSAEPDTAPADVTLRTGLENLSFGPPASLLPPPSAGIQSNPALYHILPRRHANTTLAPPSQPAYYYPSLARHASSTPAMSHTAPPLLLSSSKITWNVRPATTRVSPVAIPSSAVLPPAGAFRILPTDKTALPFEAALQHVQLAAPQYRLCVPPAADATPQLVHVPSGVSSLTLSVAYLPASAQQGAEQRGVPMVFHNRRRMQPRQDTTSSTPELAKWTGVSGLVDPWAVPGPDWLAALSRTSYALDLGGAEKTAGRAVPQLHHIELFMMHLSRPSPSPPASEPRELPWLGAMPIDAAARITQIHSLFIWRNV